MTLRDYLHVIWLRKWVVVLVLVACTATAFLYSDNQTRQYEATALMIYDPPTDISDPLSSGSSMDTNTLTLELQSVINNLRSLAVTDQATELLSQSSDSEADYTVTATIAEPDASSGATFSDTVAITGESTDPALAANVANAYAQAVIDVRAKTERARLTAAETAVRAKMDTYETEASRLSTDYLMLAQQLNQLQLAEATVTGDFEIVETATIPAAPSSPKPFQAAALGLAVGLFAGIALAFVVNQLDTRVRTYHDASELLGLPTMGRLPRLPKGAVGADRMVTLSQPEGPFAESMRMLRTNLNWAAVAGDWKSLLITSGSQGEGKSLTICNLAVAMALAGKKVVVVDADLRAPRVHAYFDLGNATGLTTVLAEPASLQAALRNVTISGTSPGRTRLSPVGQDGVAEPEGGQLLVLTAGPPPPNPGEVVASQRLADVLARLADLGADFMLVDAPPILSVGDAAALAGLVDGVLFVVDLDRSKRSLLEASREALARTSCRKVGVVFVGARADASSYYGHKPAGPDALASARREDQT